MQAFRQPGCKLFSSSSRGAQQCLSCVSSRHRLRERTVLPASSSEATGSSPSTSSTHASTDAQGSTKPAAAKPAAQSSPAPAAASSSPPPATDWEARRRQRVVNDLVDASKRLGPAFTREAIQSGVHTLESILPGLQIDIDLLKASDWARLVVDINGTANKIILLKTLYPRADLTAVVQRSPATLMWSTEELTDNAKQVKQLLSEAKDPDVLITHLPSLLEPRTLISVLVTVRKWYFNKRDPVEVLEADPDLVRRAQACGVPFEPVYIDSATGSWMAPGFNYMEKRADWQTYLDVKNNRKDYLTDEQIAAQKAHQQQQLLAKQQQAQQQQQQQQEEEEGAAEGGGGADELPVSGSGSGSSSS